ncbi:MAG: NHL repeat-containing protein [Acidobacteriota bacterium]
MKILLCLLIILLINSCSNKSKESLPHVVTNTKKGLWEKDSRKKVELNQIWAIGGLKETDQSKIFFEPKALALDSLKNIYVLDSGNNRIQKINPNGQVILSLGRKGEGPGEFMKPSDIFIDDNDKIYVADTGNARIQILSLTGEFILSFKVRKNVSSIVVDKEGNIFASVTKPDTALIYKYTQTGELLTSFGQIKKYENFLLQNALNKNVITIDSEQYIYVTYFYRNLVQKYDTQGTLLLEFSRKRPYSAKYTWRWEWEEEESGTGHGGFFAESFETLDIFAYDGIIYILLGNNYLLEDAKSSTIERYTNDGIYLDSFDVPGIFWSFLLDEESLYILDFARTMDLCKYSISLKK